MVKGRVAAASNITYEDICRVTNNGYDVFRHEIGEFPHSKAIRHPLREDRTPSAGVVYKDGMWFLKDFTGTVPTLNCVQFIERKYALSYPKALEKLAFEYGLIKSCSVDTS